MDPGTIGMDEIAMLVAVAVAALIALVLIRLSGRRPPAEQAADAPWRTQIEEELAALKQALATLREELAQLRAARGIAPQYGEAMALARSGVDAADIASRCNLSVAEAELILALADRRNAG